MKTSISWFEVRRAGMLLTAGDAAELAELAEMMWHREPRPGRQGTTTVLVSQHCGRTLTPRSTSACRELARHGGHPRPRKRRRLL
eukprot:SAG11_NODE_37681_length_255_cov_2.653846_1_plen_84_part_11